MRASHLGAVVALALAGCHFSVKGAQPDSTIGDTDDLASSAGADDLAVGGDDLTPPPPADMATPLDLAIPPDLTTPTGSLVGSIAGTSGSPINLTTEGTADWAHWGTTLNTSFDHKNGVTPQISDFTNVANSTITWLGSYAIGFTWSDGTPTASATNSTTGIYTSGNGAGFRITAPADNTTRTLRVYLGGQMSTGTLTAHLSDASAADYTVMSMFGTGDTGMMYERTVTLVYRAAAAGQTLTVSWVVSSQTGYVHLHSATLQ
jgi:hypothetical protein